LAFAQITPSVILNITYSLIIVGNYSLSLRRLFSFLILLCHVKGQEVNLLTLLNSFFFFSME